MSLYDSVELVISRFINWPWKCETRGCNIPVVKSTALDKPIAVFTVLLVYIKIYRPKTKQSGSSLNMWACMHAKIVRKDKQKWFEFIKSQYHCSQVGRPTIFHQNDSYIVSRSSKSMMISSQDTAQWIKLKIILNLELVYWMSLSASKKIRVVFDDDNLQ